MNSFVLNSTIRLTNENFTILLLVGKFSLTRARASNFCLRVWFRPWINEFWLHVTHSRKFPFIIWANKLNARIFFFILRFVFVGNELIIRWDVARIFKWKRRNYSSTHRNKRCRMWCDRKQSGGVASRKQNNYSKNKIKKTLEKHHNLYNVCAFYAGVAMRFVFV